MFQVPENNIYFVTGLKQSGLELQVLNSRIFRRQQTAAEVRKSTKELYIFALETYRTQSHQSALCTLLFLQTQHYFTLSCCIGGPGQLGRMTPGWAHTSRYTDYIL